MDEVEPEVATLEQLCRERDSVAARIGKGPFDPTWDYRHLSEALVREKHGCDGAQWRLDIARKTLQDLGPIGRRTHRAERRELERRIAGFETDIGRHDERLADLEVRLAELTPELLERISWERQHSTDLDRLETLDRHIDLNQRLERVAAREVERGIERGIGLEL